MERLAALIGEWSMEASFKDFRRPTQAHVPSSSGCQGNGS